MLGLGLLKMFFELLSVIIAIIIIIYLIIKIPIWIYKFNKKGKEAEKKNLKYDPESLMRMDKNNDHVIDQNEIEEELKRLKENLKK